MHGHSQRHSEGKFGDQMFPLTEIQSWQAWWSQGRADIYDNADCLKR